jgi:hypothetical protein
MKTVDQIIKARPAEVSLNNLNAINVESPVFSLLCWNVQTYYPGKANVVNHIISAVVDALQVDVCCLLETREFSNENMNKLEEASVFSGEMQQLSSDLTGNIHRPPVRLYLHGGGLNDFEYAHDLKKNNYLVKKLSHGNDNNNNNNNINNDKDIDDDEEEGEEGFATWQEMFDTALWAFYDVYLVTYEEPAVINREAIDAKTFADAVVVLDAQGRVLHVAARKWPRLLVTATKASLQEKKKSDARLLAEALAKKGVKLGDILADGDYTFAIAKKPKRTCVARNTLEDFNPKVHWNGDKYDIAHISDVKLPAEGNLVIFENCDGTDQRGPFEALENRSGAKEEWFTDYWRSLFDDKGASEFNIYAVTGGGKKDTLDDADAIFYHAPGYRKAAPPSSEYILQLKQCPVCRKLLGDTYQTCNGCDAFRHGTKRENLRETLRDYAGAFAFGGLESYAVWFRAPGASQSGALISYDGKAVDVDRYAATLIASDENALPLGYAQPGGNFAGRCPFLIPVTIAAKQGEHKIPIVAFHAPFGKDTVAGLGYRRDALVELFKGNIAWNGPKPIHEFDDAIVIGDFNLDSLLLKKDTKPAVIVADFFRQFEDKGFKPLIDQEPTSLKKFKLSKVNVTETRDCLSSGYDNILVKGLEGEKVSGSVVDVIEFIATRRKKMEGIIEAYFKEVPTSSKKAAWNALMSSPLAADDLVFGYFVYSQFVSDHLPVLLEIKVAARKLEKKEKKDEKVEQARHDAFRLDYEVRFFMEMLDYDVTPDGLEASVKEIQKANGEDETGKIDRGLWAILFQEYDVLGYLRELNLALPKRKKERRMSLYIKPELGIHYDPGNNAMPGMANDKDEDGSSDEEKEIVT